MNNYYVITGFCGVSGGKAPNDKLWHISAPYYAWKAENDKSFTMEEGNIYTQGDDDEMARLRSLLPAFSMVKIKASKNAKEFTLGEVLESPAAADAEADKIISEMQKPVTVNDPVLGEFTLDRSIDIFSGKLLYKGKSISLHIDNSMDEIGTAHWLYKDLENILKDAAKFAAEELTELANEWGEDDWEEDGDYIPLTEEDFARRITIREISVSEDGDYTLWFDDDDMFWGHVVCVYGNTETGFKDATMEG